MAVTHELISGGVHDALDMLLENIVELLNLVSLLYHFSDVELGKSTSNLLMLLSLLS